MLRLLFSILHICPHIHITRPWRATNGRDHYTCIDCTKVILSPIQFGKRKEC